MAQHVYVENIGSIGGSSSGLPTTAMESQDWFLTWFRLLVTQKWGREILSIEPCGFSKHAPDLVVLVEDVWYCGIVVSTDGTYYTLYTDEMVEATDQIAPRIEQHIYFSTITPPSGNSVTFFGYKVTLVGLPL